MDPEIAKRKKKPGRKPKQTEPEYPVAPTVIQTVNKPKTFVNHSYRNFGVVPALPTDTPLDEKAITDMSFSEKLHQILHDPQYKNWIGWNAHGRSFRIHVPKRLEQAQVFQKYFGHNRFSSFLRQLSNYGFKHITKGVDRNSYYHECFLRGLPHLLKYMPSVKDVRRQVPDPENEPDFYALAKAHPLPGDGKFEELKRTVAPVGVNAARLGATEASAGAKRAAPPLAMPAPVARAPTTLAPSLAAIPRLPAAQWNGSLAPLAAASLLGAPSPALPRDLLAAPSPRLAKIPRMVLPSALQQQPPILTPNAASMLPPSLLARASNNLGGFMLPTPQQRASLDISEARAHLLRLQQEKELIHALLLKR